MSNAADLPPYDRERLLGAVFPERVRLACRTWASQAQPTPFAVIVFYWVKYGLFFVGGFVAIVYATSPASSGTPLLFSAVAFQKAILWALFYESAGFGCSAGPMNARYSPPIGGFLYFLRPGTTKLPLFPGLPLLGGDRRTLFDVALYAANMVFLLRALLAPEVTTELLWPSVVLLPLLGITDTTLFLAARGEHYWVALVALAVAGSEALFVPACMLIWCAIWFWAATSKLNHHFPSVIMVMMNNGPFFPRFLKQRLFRDYPDDLRPSRLAKAMAVAGTFTEYMIPVILLCSDSVLVTSAGLLVMACFHGFIAANNPSGMPIEWNIVMIYGGIFLFGFHPEASIASLAAMPGLALFFAVMLFALPAYGNFVPSRVSFLLAMRYYAGNWAYNIWLFRKGTEAKLAKLVKAAPTFREQLEKVVPDPAFVDVALCLSMSHRFMHLEGRPLYDALPQAVDDIDEYDWVDGEILGGQVIGWNFGDGHLNGRRLLGAVQRQCGFEEGELRVISVESQPLFGTAMQWSIHDAKSGLVAEGETAIAPARALPPWPTGAAAKALAPRQKASSE